MRLKRTTQLLVGALIAVPLCGWSATFTVDKSADTVDAIPGDGTCADSADGGCSLRAAVMEANALAGEDTIQFDASLSGTPIELTRGGLDETFDASTPENPTVVDTPDASVGDLDITESVTITGLDPNVIDNTHVRWATEAETPDRIFHIKATTASLTATIENLALGNGAVGVEDIPDTTFQLRRRGGAIAIGEGATIVDTAVAGGGSGDEGGSSDDPGGDEGEAEVESVTLQRVVLYGSTAAGDAGGLFNGAPLTLAESVISGNTSDANGGGLYNDAEALIEDTLIGASAGTLGHVGDSSLHATGNQAENGGGMFDTGFHTTRIQSSAINENTAIGGGGIAGRSLVSIDIVNTTVSGNTASDVGGGITTNGSISLLNSTVLDNAAGSDAPGGGAGLNTFGSGSYSFENTIIAQNEKTGGETPVLSNCGTSGGSETPPPGAFNSLGHNLEDGDLCDLTNTGDLPSTAANASSDPTTTDPDSGEATLTPFHFLLTGSAAIDAGNDGSCPNNDQRGAIRPGDGDGDGTSICDIGAYEGAVQYEDLHIRNLVAPNRVNVGEDFEIEVVVRNSDPSETATATELTVTTDSGVTISASNPSCTGVPGNSVTCSLGDLGVGAETTAVLTASASAQGEYNVDTNVTTTNAAANDNTDNDAASASVRAIGTANVGLEASADREAVELGKQVTLSFRASNAGPDDATDVRLAGTIPSQAEFVSATADNAGTCANLSGTVVCELGTIPFGGPVVTVDVTLRAASKGDVTASASVEAEQSDPDKSDNAVSASIRFFEDDDDDFFGCTLTPGSRLDPVLPLLLLLASVGLVIRRRRRIDRG